MKKLSVLFLLFSAVVCHGEIVSEVSFNPSRMGDYRYLKVANSATLVGGLVVTDDLNISSGGTVRMKLGSTAPQYFTISGGGTAQNSPRSVDGASGSEIYMPNTVFSGDSSAYIPNVFVRGGEGTFKGGNSVVSNTMDGNRVLLQRANTLSGGTVEIAGDGGSSISLHSAGTTKGFWLHGNDIPYPKGSSSLEGATSISSCTLTWEERTTAETTPKKVKVLSLANCTTGSSSTPPSGGESKFSCGTVYEKAKQTFRYTDAFGQVNCLNAKTGTCPSHIVPGVKMNMEHGGLDCTYQATCPFDGYTGKTYEGYIIKLGLKNTGETCTADQVVWL